MKNLIAPAYLVSIMKWNIWKEFREFAVRGNIFDLAIGIVIGTAFGAVVNSLVNDVIMPPIGALLKRINFADLYINLSTKTYASLASAKADGAPTINYGLFINVLINFLIVALVMFFVIKAINRVRRPILAPATTASKDCPFCLTKIPLAATRCPACTSELTL